MIFLGILIVIIIFIIYFLFQPEKKKQDKNKNKKKDKNENLDKQETVKKMTSDELGQYQDLISSLKQQITTLEAQREKEKDNLRLARDHRMEETAREKELIQRELSSYSRYLWEQEKQKLSEHRKKYEEETQLIASVCDASRDEFRSEAEFAKEEAQKIISDLREEINGYRAQCEAINEQMRQQELLENEKESHYLQLSLSEKEDINRLIELSKTFNQKAVIYKLIWSAFLQKPFTDMINRQFGNNVPRGVIYCIENQKTHKKYIGKTSAEVSKRWMEHIKESLNIGTISRQKIHEALYGNWSDFTFSVIEVVDKDKISEREKFYIDFYQSNIYGYNQKKGG